MGKIHRLSMAVVGFLAIAAVGQAQQPLHWESSIDAAKQVAARTNRLVLVEFTAPWCGQCRAMEAEVFSQPGVAGAIEARYVPVRINVDYAPQTAKQYGITGLPTTVVLAPTPRGDVLDSMPGRMEAAPYLTRLNRLAVALARPPAAPTAHIAGGSLPVVARPARRSPPALVGAGRFLSGAIGGEAGLDPRRRPLGAPSTRAIPTCLPARTSNGGSSPIRTAMPRSTRATTWCWRSRGSKSLAALASTGYTTWGTSTCFAMRRAWRSSARNPRYYVEQIVAAASLPLAAQQARRD